MRHRNSSRFSIAATSVLVLLLLYVAVSVQAVAQDRDQPRPWLGVTFETVDRPVLSQDGTGQIVSESAVRLTGVVAESPADDARLRAGDLILEVNGRQILSNNDLIYALRSRGPGEWVELKVERRGDTLDISAHLSSRPDDTRRMPIKESWAGLTVVDISEQLHKFWGGEEERGVMVSTMEEGGPADVAGVLPGDMIASIDSETILDRGDFQRAVRRGGIGNSLEIEISRQGTFLTVELEIVERINER